MEICVIDRVYGEASVCGNLGSNPRPMIFPQTLLNVFACKRTNLLSTRCGEVCPQISPREDPFVDVIIGGIG